MMDRAKQPLPMQPLLEVYTSRARAMPSIEKIDGGAVPEPYRALLVQNGDMTPTLEKFHRCGIHLRVLRKQQTKKIYLREVVLLLDGNEKPVEYGAIKIDLKLFAPEAQQAIIEGQRPLGSILRDFAIPHTSQPKAYLRVTADKMIAGALDLSVGAELYGRQNTLFDSRQRVLAEIVEILPR